jgi:hypothetical protein
MAKRGIPWEESSSCLESSTKAYIAGFLDGDGSIMLQIKSRSDTRYGYRLQATICFYQDSIHEDELQWIRDQLGMGYVSRRKDGISELRINGYSGVEAVLLETQKFIRFKRRQVSLMLDALRILQRKPRVDQFLKVCKLADEISRANYKSRRIRSAVEVEESLKARGLLSP